MSGLRSSMPFHRHDFESRAAVLEQGPVIDVARPAFDKMSLFVDIADEEVGWLGTAKRLSPIRFRIEDVFLLEQRVTAATTVLSADGLSAFACELLAKPNGKELWENIRFWGHSHHTMGTSPSGQDDSQMLEFGRTSGDWFIRLIANKNGRMEFSVYFYDLGIKLLDVPWILVDPAMDELRKAVMAEYEAKVRKNGTLRKSVSSTVVVSSGRFLKGAGK